MTDRLRALSKSIICDDVDSRVSPQLVKRQREKVREWFEPAKDMLRNSEAPMARTESRFHRLPDGASTDDVDLYISRWRETFAAIEEVTGWECYGFNPGCSLSTGEHSTVSLRLHECQKLNDICKELLELRKAK